MHLGGARLDDDRKKWGIAEWQAYASGLEAAHQKAMDGWGRCLEEVQRYVDLVQTQGEANRVLSQNLEIALDVSRCMQFALENPLPQQKALRKPGRPKKDSGQFMLEQLEAARPRYLEVRPGASISDMSVLTWMFEEMFEQHGLGRYRARDASYQGKLRTICNQISKARASRSS